MFFNDGRRRIDFVLAYQPNNSDADLEQKRSRKREHFEAQLLRNGLELENELVAVRTILFFFSLSGLFLRIF